MSTRRLTAAMVGYRRRFWKQVEKGPGCWRLRGRVRHGGRVQVHRERMPAPRVAYALWYGEAPEGMQVCHHCGYWWCVRPDHLYLAAAFHAGRYGPKRRRAMEREQKAAQ